MRKLIIFCTLLIAFINLSAQETPSKEYMDNYQKVMQRTQWWRDARFGMFIHFGAYAVPARGEWVKSNEHLTTEHYQKYVDAFYPADFDAKKWAKIAKAAGMKYAVLTAKHHDGFCMFDSKLTDYKVSVRFKGRDIVREFLDAFRAEGLKVGLYYSLIDWHYPDYPNVGNHPQRDDKEYARRNFNWDNYLKYMYGQIEELTTNYGKLDILWFDYSFGEYHGEKWKAKELVQMVRKNQPDIILDNRLETHPPAAERVLTKFGDFESPEQIIPDEVVKDKYGNVLPWESCFTLNRSWGYNASDKNWKSSALLVHSLVNCVSKGGNMLLNVGPDARGNIPDESIAILTEIGKWMDKNSESIYGCGISELPKPEWGRYTQKGNNLFVHWMYPTLTPINVKNISDKVKNVFLLSSGSEVPAVKTIFGNNEPGNFFIKLNESNEQPDKINTVIKIELQ